MSTDIPLPTPSRCKIRVYKAAMFSDGEGLSLIAERTLAETSAFADPALPQESNDLARCKENLPQM